MATNILRPVIVGFDVHKDTIMACTFDRSSGEVGTVRQFNNTPDRIARFVRTLRASGYEPEICYEASSCGYVIFRQLRALDVECAVIAPTSIPRRFASPRQLMAYLGIVPSEHSSGPRTRRGSITKTGNTRARKAIVSAAWKYAAKPARSQALKKRQEGVSPHVIATAWKAQQRLYKRFHALAFRKPRSVANVAVARELAGFLWAALQQNHTNA